MSLINSGISTLGKTFLPALEEQLSKLDEARKEALVAHDSA